MAYSRVIAFYKKSVDQILSFYLDVIDQASKEGGVAWEVIDLIATPPRMQIIKKCTFPKSFPICPC